MSSYSSDSSWLSQSPRSDNGFMSAEHSLAKAASTFTIPENEPLAWPKFSTTNLHEPVTDATGFPVLQTKSAYDAQIAKRDKEDARKKKKMDRHAKHHKAPEPPKVPMSKAQKKKAKNEEFDEADE